MNDTIQHKLSQLADAAGRLPDAGRRAGGHLRREGEGAAQSRAHLLRRHQRPAPAHADDGEPGGRLRHHRGGQRDGSAGAGSHAHQALQAEVQRALRDDKSYPYIKITTQDTIPEDRRGARAAAVAGRRALLRPLHQCLARCGTWCG